jgi:hypothetical protein
MLTKLTIALAMGAGGYVGMATLGPAGGVALGLAGALAVWVFRKLVRRLLLVMLVLGGLAAWFDLLPPQG